jgi:hypothetical protein
VATLEIVEALGRGRVANQLRRQRTLRVNLFLAAADESAELKVIRYAA